MSIDQSINLLLDESKPVVEHTFITMKKIFDEEYKLTKKKAKIDTESFVDICSHLSLVYHMLVTSVAEAILDGKDINSATQKVLKTIKKLTEDSYISPATEAKALQFVDTVFSKSIGRA